MNIDEYLNERKISVEKALELVLVSEEVPVTLFDGIRYSVFSGGKRIRPILLIAACEAVGGDPATADNAACAVELIHTSSLIHDDLPAMDDDDLRRGKPTLHKVIGEGNAILAGDALLILAFEILAKDKNLSLKTRMLLISELASAVGMKGMVGGQVVDLAYENKEIDADTLEQIHRTKTGAMLTASVKMGGIVGGGDEEALDALQSYGENIGLAFQIVDDILDVVGDSEKLGKTTGADEARDKATYPSMYGLEKSREKADACLKAAIESASIFHERGQTLAGIAQYIVQRVI